MSSVETDDRWPMLPGPKWVTPLAAKTWLIEQRRFLGWSHKDVDRAFAGCARHSDLYLGPGGGDRFDRPTEKRVARFEQEGQVIPDWMYWMPLVIEHSKVPSADRWEWERANIPEHGDLRREREEDEAFANVYALDDDEVALVDRVRAMSYDERNALLFIADDKFITWWIGAMKRADARGVTLIDLVGQALG